MKQFLLEVGLGALAWGTLLYGILGMAGYL